MALTEPLTVLVLLKVKAEHRQEVFDLLKNSEDGAKKTKNFPGCISVEGRMSTSDDETIAQWTKWENKEVLESYIQMRKETEFFKPIFHKLLGAGPQFIFLSKDSF